MSRNKRQLSRRALGIGAYVLAAVLGAVGQICFKIVGTLDLQTLSAAASCPYLWAAGVSYVGVMGLFILGIKCVGEISTLYPVYGSTFVFAQLFSAWRLGERPGGITVLGTVLIIFGIAILCRTKEAS